MKKIPLFGTGIIGKSAKVTAQRRLNCYYEIRVDGDKSNIVIYGTPGLALEKTITGADGPIRGVMSGTLYSYVVIGSSVYKYPLDGSDPRIMGGLLTRFGPVGLANNGVELCIVDGSYGYTVNSFNEPGGDVTQITSAGFPNGARTVTFLAGVFVAELPNTGQFYCSDSYDGQTWDALNFATAEQNPDPLIAIDSYRGNLALFSARSVEHWQVSGAQDFLFAPLTGATQEIGLAAIYSRCLVNSSLYFLGQSLQGGFQVCKFVGYQATPISNPDLEFIINSFDTVDDAEALTYMVDSHFMYQLTFPSEMRSFLYDDSTGMWSEVQTGTSLQARHIGQYSMVSGKDIWITDYAQTKIYRIDVGVYTDNGTTIRREVQTRHVIDDGNVVGVDEIFLDMDTGFGIAEGQGSDPEIMMQMSKNGGRTFGAERWTPIGRGGEYSGPRAIWRRCGASRDNVFRFAMTDPVKFMIAYGAVVARTK